FLGEKLHANAMAAVAGVPFIGLEYQPKIRDFAASLDMESWIVSTAERDAEALIDKIEAVRDNRESIQNKMVMARDKLRERLASFAEEIKRR
ncbi:unnamed protein product, partial [marine sediment metagenome]